MYRIHFVKNIIVRSRIVKKIVKGSSVKKKKPEYFLKVSIPVLCVAVLAYTGEMS
jgi:hypothetical protein